MALTINNLPPSVNSKSLEVRKVFLKAYEDAISKGLSNEDALFSAHQNSKVKEKLINASKAKEYVKPKVPQHIAVLSNRTSSTQPQAMTSDTVRPFGGLYAPSTDSDVFQRAMMRRDSIAPDASRSLVSAKWDEQGRLELEFDDGQKIVTTPAPSTGSVENHVSVNNTNPIQPYLQFDTQVTTPSQVGQLSWNDTDGTLDLGLKGGNVTLQVGQEQVTHVYNNTANDFSDLQVLRITGSQGQRLTGALAQGNNEINSSTTYAVVTEAIPKNAVGFATTSGLVRNVDTSAFPEGSALYLSPTTAGAITSTKPQAPNHAVMIGWCVRSHHVQGSIYVHVQNGFELDELHNVKITSVQNGHILKYDATDSLWKNANPAAASGVTTGSFFQKIDLVAGVPLTISHNLALIDSASFTINTALNGEVINVSCLIVDNNNIQLTSAITANQVSCTIIGVIA
jgi:hypothetical protein